MKQFRFFSYIFVVIFCLGLTSCSKRDYENNLIGRWKWVHSEGWKEIEGVRTEFSTDVSNNRWFYEIYEDGSGKSQEADYIYDITWRVKGKRLIIWDDFGDDEINGDILTLNTTTLILETKRETDHNKFYEVITLERVPEEEGAGEGGE